MSTQDPTAGRTNYPVSTVLLWTAAVVLGAWGASGWFVTLHDRSLPMAIMISATFGVAPIIAAILATLLPRVGVSAKLAASVVILAFVSMDALGNARAFFAFEEIALSAELEELQASNQADLKRATDRLDAAQAAFESVPVPSATGEIRRASTYELVITPILEERKAAQVAFDRLKAQPEPTVEPLAPVEVVWSVFSLISLGMVIAFCVLSDAKARKEAIKYAPQETESVQDDAEVEQLTEALKKARSDLHKTRKDRATLRRQMAGVIEFPGQVSHKQQA